ncbi:MAG: AI-2E family transporter [Eubacterium sp.]|jgi:predicted PurR-regulated permease PerM|nr:AI-2E family transporter [Eubacterium sp.]
MELDKKTTHNIIKIAAFIVILAFLLNHISGVFAIIGSVIGLLSPFIIGGATAFIINVPMRIFEMRCFHWVKKQSLRRMVSLICAYLSILFVLTLVMGLIVPEIARTVQNLIYDFPARIQMMQGWLDDLLKNNVNLEAYFSKALDNFELYILKFFEGWDMKSSGNILSTMTGAISGTVSVMINFFMGLIFSIYLLSQKEKLSEQGSRLIAVMFRASVCERIQKVLRLSSETFRKFITGQCLEAVIFGSIFFVCMTIFSMPYALTVSVLIMLLSLIPIFGAFIACFSGAFLILFVSPIQALLFVVMFLVIQQIEGNLIYPHVVGNSVGLPSIWVFSAVLLGGNLFGIVGMLVFIPLTSVFYTLTKEWILKREKKTKQK